ARPSQLLPRHFGRRAETGERVGARRRLGRRWSPTAGDDHRPLSAPLHPKGVLALGAADLDALLRDLLVRNLEARLALVALDDHLRLTPRDRLRWPWIASEAWSTQAISGV